MSIAGAADGSTAASGVGRVPADGRAEDGLRSGAPDRPSDSPPDPGSSVGAPDVPGTPGGWIVRLIVPVTIGAFAVAFAVSVWDMGIDAAMPLACACLLVPLAVLSGWSDWRSPRQGRRRPIAPEFLSRMVHEHRPVLATLACCVALALLLPVLGGLISTAAFAVVLALALGERRPWVLGVLVAGILLVEFLVFQELLGVDLPTPIWAG